MTTKNIKKKLFVHAGGFLRHGGDPGAFYPVMQNLQTKRRDCIKSTILMQVLPQSEAAFNKHAIVNGC